MYVLHYIFTWNLLKKIPFALPFHIKCNLAGAKYFNTGLLQLFFVQPTFHFKPKLKTEVHHRLSVKQNANWYGIINKNTVFKQYPVWCNPCIKGFLSLYSYEYLPTYIANKANPHLIIHQDALSGFLYPLLPFFHATSLIWLNIRHICLTWHDVCFPHISNSIFLQRNITPMGKVEGIPFL